MAALCIVRDIISPNRTDPMASKWTRGVSAAGPPGKPPSLLSRHSAPGTVHCSHFSLPKHYVPTPQEQGCCVKQAFIQGWVGAEAKSSTQQGTVGILRNKFQSGRQVSLSPPSFSPHSSKRPVAVSLLSLFDLSLRILF